MAEQNEKNFVHYPELPLEMQMVIINKMPPDDRGRFSGSSKLSSKEVDISKNYIREFKFKLFPNDIFLHVKYGSHNNSKHGFRYKYIEKRGKKWVRTEDLKKKELGTTKLDKSANLKNCAIQHSREVLKQYQDKIKRIHIDVFQMEGDIDFGVESLKNLEEIELINMPNIQQLLSKTCKNLKDLEVYGKFDPEIKKYEQVYRVQRKLFMPSVRFTKQEFLQLSAQLIYTHVENMTAEDIFSIVKSWKKDQIRKDFVAYCWFLSNSNFEASKLFKLCGVKCDSDETKEIKIKHDKDVDNECVLLLNPKHGTEKIPVLLFINVQQAKLCPWIRKPVSVI